MNVRVQELVAEAKSGVSGMFRRYIGDWDDLFMDLTGRFINAHELFERELGKLIDPLFAEVTGSFRDFEQKAKDRFDKVCEGALMRLRSDLRAAFFIQRDKSEEHDRLIIGLRNDLPELEREVRRQRVAMAGHEGEIILPPAESDPRTYVEVVFGAAAVIGVMSLEYLTGFELWEFASSANTALGLSIITVLVTLFARLVVVHFKRYLAYLDAEQKLQTNFPVGHPDGFAVDLFPAGEKLVAQGGLAVLVVTALLFLVSRVWIALQSQDGFSGIAASVGLLLILIGYGFGEFVVARPYGKRKYEVLRELQDRLESSRSELDRLMRESDEQNVYREQADKAYAAYRQAVAQAKDLALFEAGAIDAKRVKLVEHLLQYEAGRTEIENSFRDACNLLVRTVSTKLNLDDIESPFRSPESEAKIKSRLNGHLSRRWQEPGLREIQEKKFTVSFLPKDEQIQLRTVEAEVRQSMSDWQIGVSSRAGEPEGRQS